MQWQAEGERRSSQRRHCTAPIRRIVPTTLYYYYYLHYYYYYYYYYTHTHTHAHTPPHTTNNDVSRALVRHSCYFFSRVKTFGGFGWCASTRPHSHQGCEDWRVLDIPMRCHQLTESNLHGYVQQPHQPSAGLMASP